MDQILILSYFAESSVSFVTVAAPAAVAASWRRGRDHNTEDETAFW